MVQRVARKRPIRNAVYRRRAEMALRIYEGRTGEQCFPVRLRTTWGSVLPQDRDRLVREEECLVEAGLQSKRRAMTILGVSDPEEELARIQGEQVAG